MNQVEIVNHHGTRFWIDESRVDAVLAAYNDEILHPRWQWLQLTGQTVASDDVWLMTDQPPTCPKCGSRVAILEGAETEKQIVKCLECPYLYRLEAN